MKTRAKFEVSIHEVEACTGWDENIFDCYGNVVAQESPENRTRFMEENKDKIFHRVVISAGEVRKVLDGPVCSPNESENALRAISHRLCEEMLNYVCKPCH